MHHTICSLPPLAAPFPQAVVHATGYIQAGGFPTNATKRDEERQFSVPVKEHVMGTLHDHHFNYKVDLDVLGTANSVKRIAIAAKEFVLPYAYPKTVVQKYVNYTDVTTEGGLSLYTADLKDPAWYTFSNPGAQQPNNQQGVPRSWRIYIPGTNIQQASAAGWGPSMQYMKYSVAVLQRKEEEQFSGYGLYDMQAPGEPLREFDNFINNESLVQQDLVAWVTVGKLHLPSAEDLPVTSTPGTEASFYIRPANYFDESPAIRLTRKHYKTHTAFADSPEHNVNTAVHAGEFACSDAQL
jgi:Cu2+-containing amine oxidase